MLPALTSCLALQSPEEKQGNTGGGREPSGLPMSCPPQEISCGPPLPSPGLSHVSLCVDSVLSVIYCWHDLFLDHASTNFFTNCCWYDLFLLTAL